MRELIVDSFAGGGGASTGIEMALGRSPDFAINHDSQALAMHAANHPQTEHLASNIWQVDPRDVCRGRPLGLLWASPDCKHFSKAKGGKPVERNIRDLAWTVVLWARRAKPRVIILENVEEFQDWGPLVFGEDGRHFPDPERKGEEFRRWVRALRAENYRVEWRELRACDFGAPTIRKRLFLIARRDGRKIVWPAATHGRPDDLDVFAGKKKPWRTAAEIIDWSLPWPSIFLMPEEARRIGVKRPLAEATMARIAKGVRRYVLEAKRPFIVPVTHSGDSSRVHSADEPLRTITTARRGELAVVSPFLVPRYGEREGQEPRALDVEAPLSTVVPTGNGASLVAAFLAQHNTGVVGHAPSAPLSTIVGKGCTQGLVAAHLLNLRGADRRDGPLDAPVPTVSAGGNHASLVAAFLQKYYGAGEPSQAAGEPLHTLTAKPRHGLVTVEIAGEPWTIVDIGMRMLTPRERFLAQGFPETYVIDLFHEGRRLTGEAQGRMVGNSVCPPVAAALVAANCADLVATPEQEEAA